VKFSKVLILTLFFLVITIGSSLKLSMTMGYYALFTENFIERFCENKDKPELQCDGKCALSKMLLQKAQEDKKPLNIDWLKNETVLFYVVPERINFPEYTSVKVTTNSYKNLYQFKFTQRIIHPPRI